MGIVSLKKQSGQPKYKQIVASVENAIADGVLKKGDKLPSLNAIKNKHGVSRDTVLTAFYELKTRGIINSVVGKGYYVATEHIEVSKKIFLLFDELNSFKEDLYNSFLDSLGAKIQVDIFFHHFNKDFFIKLIEDNIGNYMYYVIMPANFRTVHKVIQQLPLDKVYILDQTYKELNMYSSLYQNFEKDIQKGLFTALHVIRKYKKLLLVITNNKQPKETIIGFKKFCKQYNVNHEIRYTLQKHNIQKGDLYITFEDKDLIEIIKNIKENNLHLAKEVGLISYNDSLLKEVVENGITTISTDFKFMGKRLAQMILKNEKATIENPSKLIFRKSI